MNNYFIDPFEMFFRSSYHPSQRVVVISDSEYNELRQAEAKREVTALESKANRYRTAAADLEARIVELQEEHKLLEGTKDDKKLSGATK